LAIVLHNNNYAIRNILNYWLNIIKIELLSYAQRLKICTYASMIYKYALTEESAVIKSHDFVVRI
jgi:hypothetical protein